jgi:hypothetical protein
MLSGLYPAALPLDEHITFQTGGAVDGVVRQTLASNEAIIGPSRPGP